jgi:nicotinate-nucleotide adenylyltransferase
MRIGIFGGAFNPVHIHHAEICEGIIGELGLAKLIVVPSFNPPHKNMAEDNFFERVEMLKAALLRNGNEKDEKIEISLIEYNGKKRNYAYEIVGEIAEQYPVAELFYIVGGDVVREFLTWKNPERITALATIVVVDRSGYSSSGKDLSEGNSRERGSSESISSEYDLSEGNSSECGLFRRDLSERNSPICGSSESISPGKDLPESDSGGGVSGAAELLKTRLSAKVFISKIERVDISSAHVRTLISLSLDASKYLPNGVEEIIRTAGLYRGFDGYVESLKGLCSAPLFDHIRRTTVCAVKENERIGLDYSEVFLSALLHDAAKEIKFIFVEKSAQSEKHIENTSVDYPNEKEPTQFGRNDEKINIDCENGERSKQFGKDAEKININFSYEKEPKQFGRNDEKINIDCENGERSKQFGRNAEKVNINFPDEKERIEPAAVLKIDGEWLKKRREKIGEKYYERLKNAEFYAPKNTPLSVLHQYTGAELAEKVFKISDKNILGAIRFHTTAKPEMTLLEKLIYTADKIESERDYEGVEGIRNAMKNGLDEGFLECLKVNYAHILNKKINIHGLTKEASEYYLWG